MQTHLSGFIQNTAAGQEANSILRQCVHCGFCLATCPTYNLLSDELDSPRGRIYLIKQMLEGAPVSEKTQLHLDRCLTCRACETTCPSGVQYGRLLDIGRERVKQQVKRKPAAALKRWILHKVLLQRRLFALLLSSARLMKNVLPGTLASKIPSRRLARSWPAVRHTRRMLILDGCVQPALAPDINASAAYVLDALGISLIRAAEVKCCGAISHHLDYQQNGLTLARQNIDAWWPDIEQGIEAIVVTASGCGTMIADYAHLLRHDAAYAEKARVVSALFLDISQVVVAEKEALIAQLKARKKAVREKIAFHSPCSLQHGLKMAGLVENFLLDAGYELVPVPDSHLCCGSAGTYSLLQPALSQRLLANKVAALTTHQPGLIVTANIGCLVHIEGGLNKNTPIRHWIELIADDLAVQ